MLSPRLISCFLRVCWHVELLRSILEANYIDLGCWGATPNVRAAGEWICGWEITGQSIFPVIIPPLILLNHWSPCIRRVVRAVRTETLQKARSRKIRFYQLARAPCGRGLKSCESCCWNALKSSIRWVLPSCAGCLWYCWLINCWTFKLYNHLA